MFLLREWIYTRISIEWKEGTIVDWQVNGKIRKIKVPRELEEEELRMFSTQHDNEMKRLARILGAFNPKL
jgi:hypothetical protein